MFAIRPNTLETEREFLITVQLVRRATGQVLWSRERTIRVNDPPVTGNLKVAPSEGAALTSEFTIVADGWIVRALPALY